MRTAVSSLDTRRSPHRPSLERRKLTSSSVSVESFRTSSAACGSGGLAVGSFFGEDAMLRERTVPDRCRWSCSQARIFVPCKHLGALYVWERKSQGVARVLAHLPAWLQVHLVPVCSLKMCCTRKPPGDQGLLSSQIGP
jgi:hypothetical protein